jgi:hypothetical protein
MKIICAWHKINFPEESDQLGECEPLNNNDLTHGICERCLIIMRGQ